MALVLDAGAFIAVERGHRGVLFVVAEAQRQGVALVTSSAVVAQVWQGDSRQARLARFLPSVGEEALGPDRSRKVGELLAANGTSDVVDAALVDVAGAGDQILTSDAEVIAQLVAVAGRRVLITPI